MATVNVQVSPALLPFEYHMGGTITQTYGFYDYLDLFIDYWSDILNTPVEMTPLPDFPNPYIGEY